MSEYGITVENLLSVFPEALSEDEDVIALATAVAEVLASRPEEINEVLIYPRIDELSSELLDILAVDFAIDWWDGSWSVDRKRQTLKESWKIHRILGTPDALSLAVQSAFGSGRIEEWFDYDGKPHHFRILGLTPEVATNGLDAFLRLLSIVKRESSVLDAVVIDATGEQSKHNLYVGFAVSLGLRMSVTCEIPEDLDVTYLVDENGDTLLDEDDNRLIDEEV